jgi:hypothetical protein
LIDPPQVIVPLLKLELLVMLQMPVTPAAKSYEVRRGMKARWENLENSTSYDKAG